MEFLHSYGLKYLIVSKLTASYWSSAPSLGAIKPKFETYMKGFNHITKLLTETLINEAKRGEVTSSFKGFKLIKSKSCWTSQLNSLWTKVHVLCMEVAAEGLQRRKTIITGKY